MKLLSAATALLCLVPLSVTARSIDFLGYSQAPIHAVDSKSVQGNNPLEYCQPDTSKDILQIKSVDLDPNPPLPGKTLTIKASGTLKKTIDEGAYVLLTVKYGLITLIKQNADLCEQLGNVDLECPLKEGDMTLTKQVDLPREIPPGKYSVHAEVISKDNEPITCLDAHNIEFKPGWGF